MLQNVKYCEDVSCGKLLLPGERYLEYKGRCFCHFACLQRATMLHFRIDEVIRKNAPPHKESTTRIGSDPLPPDYRGFFFLRRALMIALRFGNLCYHRFILASPFARGRRD